MSGPGGRLRGDAVQARRSYSGELIVLAICALTLLGGGFARSIEDNKSREIDKIERSQAMVGRHRWSDEDDVVALYLSLYGDAQLPVGREEIAKRLGMSEGSLRMREGNFKHLHRGGGGLANVACRSRRMFEAFKDHSEPDLRDRVRAVIARK